MMKTRTSSLTPQQEMNKEIQHQRLKLKEDPRSKLKESLEVEKRQWLIYLSRLAQFPQVQQMLKNHQQQEVFLETMVMVYSAPQSIRTIKEVHYLVILNQQAFLQMMLQRKADCLVQLNQEDFLEILDQQLEVCLEMLLLLEDFSLNLMMLTQKVVCLVISLTQNQLAVFLTPVLYFL